jgi:hypothetical protein
MAADTDVHGPQEVHCGYTTLLWNGV